MEGIKSNVTAPPNLT